MKYLDKNGLARVIEKIRNEIKNNIEEINVSHNFLQDLEINSENDFNEQKTNLFYGDTNHTPTDFVNDMAKVMNGEAKLVCKTNRYNFPISAYFLPKIGDTTKPRMVYLSWVENGYVKQIDSITINSTANTSGYAKQTVKQIRILGPSDSLIDTSTTIPLSANQGKVLNDKIEAMKPVNSLISDSTEASLAAAAGKTLNDKIEEQKTVFMSDTFFDELNLIGAGNSIATIQELVNLFYGDTTHTQENFKEDLMKIYNGAELRTNSVESNRSNLNVNCHLRIRSDRPLGFFSMFMTIITYNRKMQYIYLTLPTSDTDPTTSISVAEETDLNPSANIINNENKIAAASTVYEVNEKVETQKPVFFPAEFTYTKENLTGQEMVNLFFGDETHTVEQFRNEILRAKNGVSGTYTPVFIREVRKTSMWSIIPASLIGGRMSESSSLANIQYLIYTTNNGISITSFTIPSAADSSVYTNRMSWDFRPVNSLTSDKTDQALSAAQGKILNEKIVDTNTLIYRWDFKTSSQNADNISLFQEIINKHNEGKNIIIVSESSSYGVLTFEFGTEEVKNSNNQFQLLSNYYIGISSSNGVTSLAKDRRYCIITVDSSNTVTEVSTSYTGAILGHYIDTQTAYSSPFIPTQDYHPTTKKYVDDQIANNSGKTQVFSWDGTSSSSNSANLALWQEIYNASREDSVVVVPTYSNSNNRGNLVFGVNSYTLKPNTSNSIRTPLVSIGFQGGQTTGNYNVFYYYYVTVQVDSNGNVTSVGSMSSSSVSTDSFLSTRANPGANEFVPTLDYHPATKKYVDDKVSPIDFNKVYELSWATNESDTSKNGYIMPIEGLTSLEQIRDKRIPFIAKVMGDYVGTSYGLSLTSTPQGSTGTAATLYAPIDSESITLSTPGKVNYITFTNKNGTDCFVIDNDRKDLTLSLYFMTSTTTSYTTIDSVLTNLGIGTELELAAFLNALEYRPIPVTFKGRLSSSDGYGSFNGSISGTVARASGKIRKMELTMYAHTKIYNALVTVNTSDSTVTVERKVIDLAELAGVLGGSY